MVVREGAQPVLMHGGVIFETWLDVWMMSFVS
jgi:hypothetical protein